MHLEKNVKFYHSLKKSTTRTVKQPFKTSNI